MSDAVVKLTKNRKPKEQEEPKLSPNEAKALAKIQAEAKEHGATLATDGKGGLPPSQVLGIMRRDGPFRCTVCGGKKDLSIHHKGGISASARLVRLGHKNINSNLITICDDCHNRLHEKAREKGIDSSQQKESKK